MPLNRPRPRKGNDRRYNQRRPVLPIAPPGISKEYKVSTSKFQTWVPCNDDDIIQDGILTSFRSFVGKTLQDFVDYLYMEGMDDELNGA